MDILRFLGSSMYGWKLHAFVLSSQYPFLRTYTKAFGSRLVKLFSHLRHQVSSVRISTTSMDGCEDASLKQVAHYLRGCAGLSIPPEWRPLLPSHL